MFPVNFNKQKSQYYLDCIATGKNIEPQDPAGWTVNEMASFGGACFCAILSHGPISKAMAEMKGETLQEPEHPEHREADEELLFNDIHAAFEFIAQLTMLIKDEVYDETFEEHVQCGVSQEVNVISKQVAPITGFKNPGESESI